MKPALPRRVVVVGAGFAGTMLSAHLVRAVAERAAGVSVTLLDASGGIGLGEAYRTVNPSHLLNVRARAMSAFPEAPDDFVQWLADRLGADAPGPDDFAPRMLYARYLRDRFDAAMALAPGALTRRTGAAVDIVPSAGGLRVWQADGHVLDADAVALCVGNAAAAPVTGTVAATADQPGWIVDPWAPDAFAQVAPTDPVLVLGTGLSMVDAILSLDDVGHRDPILALSRRGLVPTRHADRPEPPLPLAGPAPIGWSASRLVRHVRAALRDAQARGADWRPIVDGLRPITQDLWQGASLGDRARLLRHLRPIWDVHRHRIAPAAADRLDAIRAQGRLRIAAGRVVSLGPGTPDGFTLVWRPRGADRPQAWTSRIVVNCTGPASALEGGAHPLLQAIVRQGLARPDPLGLGIETGDGGAVIDASGRPSDRLFALGPPDRGRAWETTAVPDIRRQVAELAAWITGPR
jgi:uncharacterized NAD(P)/FAD-binding protein YdhS